MTKFYDDGFRLVRAANGAVFLKSNILSCPHGFSTRLGGVSALPHTASMNLAFGRGDDDTTVLRNLELFSEAVGLRPESVISLRQIHSADVLIVGEADAGAGYYSKQDSEAADGYVTVSQRVTLGIKTADCVPILFEDPSKNIVGAVHAGWRGTAAGIVRVCIRKMTSLGASPENIRAAIGPAICFGCYEVGDDFAESFHELAVSSDAAAGHHQLPEVDRFIRIPENSADGRLHADIVGWNRELLLSEGVLPENIAISSFCTMENPDLFYSHRYSEGKRGTMLSVISPRRSM